ncbi:ATP-binding protein [Paenibacillus sp.]|uniref:ATP-binding protein n=1 Tax=Paenibacillus sp. TaxID=58172 RepID=UPI002810D597|nr:ATP-binding protein [Paenibacillus sp.]
MRTVAYVGVASVALAIDWWLSSVLIGPARYVWIGGSNAVLFVIFGLAMRKLYRDIRTAERGLMRFTREAVSLYSLQGQSMDMNEQSERLTGYSKGELQGMPFDAWFPEHWRPRAREAFAMAAEGRPQHFDSVCVCKDKTNVDVEVSYVPVLSGNRIVGVYGILKDISEMKRNRELLQQSEKLAVVGELAAGIAHEIRNPLTSLKGFMQLSHKNHPTYYTQIMLSEIDRIHAITSELLLLGKPKALDFENKALMPLLEAILTLVNTQAILYNVQIVTLVRPGADGVVVRCEETKIKQVFLNVLKNAVEAMPNGGDLTIALEREGAFVRVSVADQGVGISQEQLAKLGQAFFTTKENGTGLGLMISLNIIEQHGGRLAIESEEGVGTKVDIRLPIIET